MSPIWHSHDALELNFITEGRGVYFLDNAQHDLAPGTLVWLLPNQSHLLLPGPDLAMWLLTCSSDRCERDLLDDVARHPCRVLARDDAIALDRLFSYISQDADEPKVYRAGIDYALRSARHITVSGSDAPTPTLHPAVSAALRVLRDCPETPNAAALAEKCGVSQDYLRELLMEQTGRGFVEWRNRCRLERFQILYPESGDLLTAALASGFGSYAHFHRVFCEVVGVTPGEWVKGSSDGAAPPVVDFSPAPDRASSRMIWYPLAELAIPELGRWFGPKFAEALLEGGEELSPPVESGVTASYDLRRFEPDLVRSVAEQHSRNAKLLEDAFHRSDVIASYANLLSGWGYGLDDVAVFIAGHLAIAWLSANRRSHPDRPRMDRLCNCVRRALATYEGLASASLKERQRVVAAICAQGYIMRAAIVAAGASGRRDVQERVVAGIRSTTLATYGWDPAGAELPG